MNLHTANLQLSDRATVAIERIATVRSGQGIPMATDTILSGIVNTYAESMLEAVMATNAYDQAVAVQVSATFAGWEANHGPE